MKITHGVRNLHKPFNTIKLLKDGYVDFEPYIKEALENGKTVLIHENDGSIKELTKEEYINNI